ncbi:MAG: type secretion protein [Pseudomonas sp.]|jgi:type VI secretion system protein VasD|nr:type secretion protein [Pseudomonas sp.]
MYRSVVLAAMTLLMLGGCAKDGPVAQAVVPDVVNATTLSFQAAQDLNPGVTGQAAPVRVRIYELKNSAAFLRADYFALADRAPATLGVDLIDQDEVLVQPGETRVIVRHLDPAARHVGLAVGYREIDRALWRTLIDVSAGRNTEHRIKLDMRSLHVDHATPATRPAQ